VTAALLPSNHLG